MASLSPRQCSVPSLARSTPLKVTHESSSVCSVAWMKRVHDYLLPILLVVALLVAAILAWIANDHADYVTALGWPCLLHFGPLTGLVICVALLGAAYATATAHGPADRVSRMVLLGAFVLVAVLLLVGFWFFYRRRDHSTAFYLALAALVVAVVHTYFSWRYGGLTALLSMVPLLAVLAVAVWLLARANWSCTVTTPPTP